MNIESMRIRSYRSFKVGEHVPAQAAERYRTLQAYAQLRQAVAHRRVFPRRLIRRPRRVLQHLDRQSFGTRRAVR